MAQYVVSSVIQGLLGRQPDMMGSWGTYCSLNLMYLPGVAAGGDQGHQPQPPWGHDRDVVGMCPSSTEPQLPSLLRAVVPATSCCDVGAPVSLTGTQPMAGAATATHPSRQMEDFTLVLAMAFLQYSIWGQVQGRCWGAWQLVPPRSCPHPSPHSPLACSNPCSWSARDTRGWVRARWGWDTVLPPPPWTIQAPSPPPRDSVAHPRGLQPHSPSPPGSASTALEFLASPLHTPV